MSTVVLASGNAGKIRELQHRLGPQQPGAAGYTVVAQNTYDVPDVAETGLTFVENAIIKARNAAQHTGLPALADDSGLEVDALKGAPGIYSARYSGEQATDASNNAKLLEALTGVPTEQRTARFQCVLVFMQHAEDPTPLICQGSWEGLIVDDAQGDNGFGYDPLFWVPDQQCTAAQLPPEIKNQLSHRGQAMTLLQTALQRKLAIKGN